MRLFAKTLLASLALLVTTSCGERIAHAEFFQVVEFKKVEREQVARSFYADFKPEVKVAAVVTPIPSRVQKKQYKKSNKIKKVSIQKKVHIKDEFFVSDEVTLMDSSVLKTDGIVKTSSVAISNIISHEGFVVESNVEKLNFDVLVTSISFPKDEIFVVAEKNLEREEKSEEVITETMPIPAQAIAEVEAVETAPVEVKAEIAPDEIVAFEYSNEVPENAPESSGPISNNVMGALNRIYTEKNVEKSEAKDLKQIVNRLDAAPTRNEILAAKKAGLVTDGTTIQAVKVHAGVGTDNLDNSFEYSDSINDTETDLANHEGKIVVSQKGIISGLVNSPNSMPTSIEYHSDGSIIYVPVLGLSSLRDFAERKEIDLYGGHVLIELSDALDDVEIDSQYSGKILFNEKFREVQALEDATFVMFIGVTPGNTTVKYKIGAHFASTVRLVVEDELTYESRALEANSISQHIIDFWLPLGRTSVEESIDHLSIIPFLNSSSMSKIGINGIKVENPYKLKDSKEYLQVTDELSNRYFISLGENARITVPTNEINQFVFRKLSLSSLENACLVVINVDNISAVDAILQTPSGNQKLNIYSLSENGQFNYEVDESTRKLIFTAQDQGVIRYRITDNNGKQITKKSYCSLGAYLIE